MARPPSSLRSRRGRGRRPGRGQVHVLHGSVSLGVPTLESMGSEGGSDERTAARDDLRRHTRAEVLDVDRVVALRGGPDSVAKLERHARRTHRAFELDGGEVFGVSVFCALDDRGPASLDELLSARLASYRWVHVPTVQQLGEAGFSLLATFGRPHYTLLLDSVDVSVLRRLEAALGPVFENPYHRRDRPRPMR